jgi:hypothetical protein
VTLRATLALLLCLAVPGQAAEPEWFVLSREDGCLDLTLLARRERLPRVPASPEEYARLLAERGDEVKLDTPDGLPAEYAGRAVRVTVNRAKAPIFVTAEFCRALGR